MNDLGKGQVILERVGESALGQRIDNFLFRALKGVPKSHVYQLLRSGQVRVNSRRIGAQYRLQDGDLVRIPPVRVGLATPAQLPGIARAARLTPRILYQDSALIALDKPAGVAVHGGSGVSFGVIEQMRAESPQLEFLELVHRLDRDTSGVLLLAKKRSALLALHRLLREGGMEKRYYALVKGRWSNARQSVRLSLHKYLTAEGERRVAVHDDGLAAHTVFRLQRAWPDFSLIEAELKTGRTHQIRVHLAHLGFPIANDDKYGDFAWNKGLARTGLRRMFLHAAKVVFAHPLSGERTTIEAPLPVELENFLDRLRAGEERRGEHAASL
jgi:23S rRNA pseudouridine955/2504/2580 synthase